MSPQSNSSSLGAQNGSAYSSSYPTRTGDSRNPPQRQLSDPSAVGYNRRDRNAPTSDSTSTHQDSSSDEQYTGAQTNTGPHYLPVYERETPRYENELTFDDDHQNTAPAAETPSYGGYTQQAPSQNQSRQNNQPNGAHPPATERWTAEQSPEERLRLGLSRYPSEEERRLAYEDAVDHESHRGQ